MTFHLQIQENQRQFLQRFAWRFRQVAKGFPSLPDEASRRNFVEIVFGFPVFVIGMFFIKDHEEDNLWVRVHGCT